MNSLRTLYHILKIRLPFIKAPDYIEYRRAKLPESQSDYTYHHLLGSYMGEKTTDYFGVFLSPFVHNAELQQRLNEAPEEYVADAIAALVEYIEHLKACIRNNNQGLQITKELSEKLYKEGIITWKHCRNLIIRAMFRNIKRNKGLSELNIYAEISEQTIEVAGENFILAPATIRNIIHPKKKSVENSTE